MAAKRPGSRKNLVKLTARQRNRIIQHRLILLMHARRCRGRDNRNASCKRRPHPRRCSLRHCESARILLHHVAQCVAGSNCTFCHCSSTRRIIAHWNNCVSSLCLVCAPLRLIARRQTEQRSLMNHTQSGQADSGITQARHSSQTNFQHAPAASTVQVHGTPRLSHNTQPQNQGGYFSTPESPNGTRSYQAGLPDSRRWQTLITRVDRRVLIQRIVSACIPTLDLRALRDRRLYNFVVYIATFEQTAYDFSTSLYEYQQYLARTLLVILIGLEARRRRRRG